MRQETLADDSQGRYLLLTVNHEFCLADGSCVFQIEVVINFEMYSVFMSYGAGLKVLSPRVAVKIHLNSLAAFFVMQPRHGKITSKQPSRFSYYTWLNIVRFVRFVRACVWAVVSGPARLMRIPLILRKFN